MPKWVVLITGTPCVGKTSVSRILASKLGALYVNLTEVAMREKLVSGKDKERDSIIVDELRMRHKMEEIIRNCSEKAIIIDGHYAVNVVPPKLATHVFVLRRDPVQLHKFMKQYGFSGRKLWENLASEILDVCLVDALNVYEKNKVCELDVTNRTVEDAVDEILEILNGVKKCRVGVVDWLGKLEGEGLLDNFLKI